MTPPEQIDSIIGPGHLPCDQRCEVPEGVTMSGVPTPRHDWPDIFVCPNGCGRAWTIEATEAELR